MVDGTPESSLERGFGAVVQFKERGWDVRAIG